MEKLIDLLRESKYCVVLTGAGVSTFSGIPDFRGSGGLYSNFDADKIFSFDYFVKNPSYFYSVSKDFIYNLDEREPGLPHKVIAKMESMGLVKSIITQNIDMLHQKAGSKNVIEIHGSPKMHTCRKCGMKYPFEKIAALVNEEPKAPRCDLCGGIIKPDIIFYGEMLEQETIEAAINEASKADLFLTLGTSLVVQPAASLPFYCINNGGKLVIVNNMDTPMDGYAELRFNDIEDFCNNVEKSLFND
ncbi:NAD-dependent deacetylase [Methanohalophilus levihalophilus]|uniref:SIR2 family NAD-dependent protein deacylase n=1 Tax=Methanohalophilus levihalophilus TaxID=1431282 RepID=UPI001AEA4D8B|nr:NAD-dependent protein deacylase [Methanohalophilus levihalophilus]MBP2029347.1 NAD-dependent deacetylase [Methanohalophilus levihalophilus]